MFKTTNDIKNELNELYPYFKEIADHILSLDTHTLARSGPPDVCYSTLRTAHDNDMIERVERILGHLKNAVEDFFDPPGVTISRAYSAAESMQVILKGQERLAEYYGEPEEYINSERFQSGKTIFHSIQDTVNNAMTKLSEDIKSFGLHTDMDREFLSDYGFIQDISEKYRRAADKIAHATTEMYTAMTDRGGEIGTGYRNDPNVNRAEQIIVRYENDVSDFKKSLSRAAKGICWTATLMDMSKQWMGRQAAIEAYKDEFFQERQRANKAISMIDDGLEQIRGEINRVKELTLDVELDKPNAEKRLADITHNHKTRQDNTQNPVNTIKKQQRRSGYTSFDDMLDSAFTEKKVSDYREKAREMMFGSKGRTVSEPIQSNPYQMQQKEG